MMFFFAFIMQLFISQSHAQNIDQKLQKYIIDFKLRSLDKTTVKNQALFNVGRELFFDKTLSGNKNISCAECHHPSVMTHDGLPLALGEGSKGLQSFEGRRQGSGKLLARNSPALFNLTNELPFMFWDGRVSFENGQLSTPVPVRQEIASTITNAIAAQALFPLVDHAEMRGAPGSNPIANANTEEAAWDLLAQRIENIDSYKKAFAELYPGEKLNIAHIAEAIAEFEREAFFFTNTSYDRYLRGDLTAMTEIQKLGMDVFFNKGKCGECHNGANLTNFEFHNIAIPQIGPGKISGDDLGRYNITHDPKDLYAFKVPGLRNVSLTGPYMHDGSFKTIAQVIEHYDRPEFSLRGYTLVNNWKNYVESITGADHTTDDLKIANLSPKLQRASHFVEEDEKALAEFLKGALTDKRFLDQEISSDYATYMRFQLQKTGFDKFVIATEAQSHKSSDLYYYFDLFVEGGYALRELEQPVKLMIISNIKGNTLLYRKQLHKMASAQNGIVLDARFNVTEYASIENEISAPIISAYEDMFKRLYTYITPENQAEIPPTELMVMRNDVEVMNQKFKEIKFDNRPDISDLMNRTVKDLFFVPTSSNAKETYAREVTFNNHVVTVNLQSSLIRTEVGGLVETWAIEFETKKILKKDMEAFSVAVFKYLTDAGLVAKDIGGQSPSPSITTEKVLNLMYP